ncbi:MAG TPA: hypothetical protein VFX70_15905 [Mycobacteriales bacterium]|nr:hypothetical protein [Mycobacteriales bacterium]
MRGGNRSVTAFSATTTATVEVAWREILDADGDATYEVSATGPWGVVTETASDAFEALVQVRRRLEPDNWFLAVAGARRDTYPSGMAREHGGLRAYVLQMGHPATELVSIFDDAPRELVAGVDEQREYSARVARSFR